MSILMCGLFVSNHPLVQSHHEQIIEQTLRFRGPDCSSGLIAHGNWKLYHSRLSIIDLNSGVNQPFIDYKGGALVFNGEILNYQDLGLKYFSKKFQSDTALLSQLIAENCLDLNELDGFFAFVYIDKNGYLQHAARDRFGVKPLFFYENDGYIAFSSEPNTLKKIFSLQVNGEAIDEYKALRAPMFSESFYSGIKQVPPGCCLKTGSYFDLIQYFNSSKKNVTQNELKITLEKSIATRKVSDAPVGLLLSMGIDSNLLRKLGEFSNYYSIGFEGDADFEFLKKQNIENLKLVEYSATEFKTDFEYLLSLRGEPLSVPNEVALFRIAKIAAKDGIKVLLSGEGADEFFGGYDRIFNWAAKQKVFDLTSFLDFYSYSNISKNSQLYKKFENLFFSCEGLNCFEKVRWFFIRYHMPILFRRLDFSLMAAGVEGREPLANIHVFKLAMNYCLSQLMVNDLGKYPLRRLIANYMGNEFAFEKKVGFPIDLTNIYDNPKQLTSYELWFEKNLEVLS